MTMTSVLNEPLQSIDSETVRLTCFTAMQELSGVLFILTILWKADEAKRPHHCTLSSLFIPFSATQLFGLYWSIVYLMSPLQSPMDP